METESKSSESPGTDAPARRAGPFSDRELAKRASAKGHAVQRATREALERIAKDRPDLLTGDVGPICRAGAVKLAAEISAGAVPVRYVHHVASAIRALVDVARIEAGQPTALSATLTADARDFSVYVEGIRKQALAAAQQGTAEPTGRDDGTGDAETPSDTAD